MATPVSGRVVSETREYEDDRTTSGEGILLRGITKRFGSQEAVSDVDLEVFRGEFFTMLGPSGSGKTTLLRLIAGFEVPDAGTISLRGVDVTGLPPYQRGVNTVFQDYALFPHFDVARERGLRSAGSTREARRDRSSECRRRSRW